ncbi:hypothetical protein [Streptomyces sp. NPDC059247]|uniref:hypothetical protein n=1 Tax=Streptomyces sp. NPDC059247 TaxID=3346790 RepID=UPI003689483A
MPTPAPPSDARRNRRRRRRDHTPVRHFVRGLSYGTGLTLAGLLGYWVQQML